MLDLAVYLIRSAWRALTGLVLFRYQGNFDRVCRVCGAQHQATVLESAPLLMYGWWNVKRMGSSRCLCNAHVRTFGGL